MHSNLSPIRNYPSKLLLILCIATLPAVADAQQELTWIKIFSSIGGSSFSPGFIYDTSGFLYMPIVYMDTLHFETGGNTKTVVSGGNGDILFIKSEMNTGNIVKFCQFTSKAHLVATSIISQNNLILISGSSRDSIFMKSDMDELQYIGGTTGQEIGFLLKLTLDCNFYSFSQPLTEMYQSGINFVRSGGQSSLLCGTMRSDSIARISNVITLQGVEGNNQLVYDTINRIDIRDATFFDGEFWVCGSFSDTLMTNDSTIVPIADNQAFLSKMDTASGLFSNLITWKSYQSSFVAGMVVFEDNIWVALNFSDSLFFSNESRITSIGESDAVLLKYDSTFVLRDVFQFGGAFSERIDQLFADEDRVYVLGNSASPEATLLYNEQAAFTIQHENTGGFHVLFTIDSDNNTLLEWTAQEGRIGRITSVSKINNNETIISGIFSKPLIIDSTTFLPEGIQDVFLLRASDICLNNLKSTESKFLMCKGDSVKITGAIQVGKYELRAEKEACDLYIKDIGRYYFNSQKDCGCSIADTLKIEYYNYHDAKMISAKWPNNLSQTIVLTDQSEIKIEYCGVCPYLEKAPKFSILPNPTTTSSGLEVFMPEACDLVLSLFNAGGNMIYQKDYSLTAGNHTLNLNSELLQPGTYLLRVLYNYRHSSASTSLFLIKL